MDFENLVINKLDKIEEKQDKLQTDVNDLKIQRAKDSINIDQNTKDLTEHIRRTNILEDTHRASIKRFDSLEKSLAPLTVRQLLKRVVVIAGGLATVAGAAIALSKLFDL
jgi:hypothetical protein